MPSESVSILYRPVGKAEFEKIEKSGFNTFPARLPGQPILKTVGNGRIHWEYWIPAEDIDEFNANLIGQIEVVEKYEWKRVG